MSEQVINKIQQIQKELFALNEKKDFFQARRVVLSIIGLLDDSISIEDKDVFQLFTDSGGKIKEKASWFYEDSVIADRKATYKIYSNNNLNIDFKLYGLTKIFKGRIAWIQALTPNFEDEPYNKSYNVGIDFVIPESFDKVIIILSNNWIIRTLELKGELTATYQEIFAKWAEIKHFDNKQELHKILWDSFDIHPLNKKFYAGISERFNILRQYLVKNKVFDEKHASFFTNRLLGRIIFCWFLSKKGIINPDFKYFNSENFADDNKYYREKLEKLFFEVLNTPIEDRKVEDKVTPFLNGGLFEARENDLYKDLKLIFPKNYFDELYNFLLSYNFTTDESTSQFQQVAIDPEMLGRIFENLLAEITEETGEQARKAKGAFYTPREIVDYMCKESLKEYLKTKIKEDEFRDQRLYQLIEASDKDFNDQISNWRNKWKPYKENIIKALDELKVLDPACGSGAFPIGMLQLLVKVYERLESRFDSYKTKLGIIEKNIYGVDIEPMAIEISRLRTWLSIIVDEESDSKKIKPLPNLEFKFVCANSLIDLNNGTSVLGDDPDLDVKLQNIRDAYFNTESLNKKKKLRLDYEKLVSGQKNLFGESLRSKQLKTYRPFDNEVSAAFFDPEFMFGIKNFSMVIGNPPYIQLQSKTSKEKNELKSQNYQTYVATGDLYCLFYERGWELLGNDGVLSFITSNKWMRAGYGKALRDFFIIKTNPIVLLDLGSNVFEGATVDTSILIFSKSANSGRTKAIKITGAGIDKQVQQANIINFNYSNGWFIGSNEEISLKEKIERNGKPLKDWDVKINRGILTGLNEAFIIDKETRDRLIAEDQKSEEIIKPILRGRDIKKYGYEFADLYILTTGYDTDIPNLYPAIYNYLLQFEESAKSRQDQGKHWWNLRACIYYGEFQKDKILYSEIVREPRFYFDNSRKFYTEATAFIMTGDNIKYICGLLNSTPGAYFFKNFYAGGGLGENGYRYKKKFLEDLPIPKISNKNKLIIDQIERLVGQIIKIKSENKNLKTEELEDEVDQLVCKLYDLNEKEKALILK